jgi:ribose 1,5-bisphosphokinase PhnN
MKPMQRLFILVGSPGSGKDLLIQAINAMGAQHAEVVPKHTSRERWSDDGMEMVCRNDVGYNLSECAIKYSNYGDQYGIDSSLIWDSLRKGVIPVVVVSNVDAINQLRDKFDDLIVLVYVHSEVDAEKYQIEELKKKGVHYVQPRVAEYRQAYEIYLNNFQAFDHVLIYCNDPEDLYDQIFRLFRAYERRNLYFDAPQETSLSERFWSQVDGLVEGKTDIRILGHT